MGMMNCHGCGQSVFVGTDQKKYDCHLCRGTFNVSGRIITKRVWGVEKTIIVKRGKHPISPNIIPLAQPVRTETTAMAI